MKMKRIVLIMCLAAMLSAVQTHAQTFPSDAATYQGFLKDGGVPANGSYDVTIGFYDALSGGNFAGEQSFFAVAVVNGTFTVNLANANNFPMFSARYLEIKVRRAGTDTYTTLNPRQPVTSVPYAFRSALALDSLNLGGAAANQYLKINDANSLFIQSSQTPQASASFNIGGIGKAVTFDAAQYRLNGARFLADGSFSVFLGVNAGNTTATTLNGANTFVGSPSGTGNTSGQFNSYFGSGSGEFNQTGSGNAFFGYRSGQSLTGSGNVAFGSNAGAFVGDVNRLTMIGSGTGGISGLVNATAIGANAFVNRSNALVLGSVNGANGATADTDVGIGTVTPTFKLHVFDASNTGLRVQTNGSGGTVASFGGLGAFRVDSPGTSGGRFTILENGNAGFGTNNPSARLNVVGGGFGANLFVTDSNPTATTFDLGNTSAGGRTWRFQSMGSGDGNRVGGLELWNVGGNFALGVAPNGNVGFGTSQPQSRVHVAGGLTVNGALNYFDTSGNANFFMKSAGAANGINFAVVGNAGVDSTLYIAQFDGTTYKDKFILDGLGNITMPTGTVTIGQVSAQTRLNVLGSIYQRAAGGGEFPACFGALQPEITRPLAACSSSIRYKNNIQNYTPGLDLVRRLRPVSFNWKASNNADFGLVAEEVATVEPLLTTTNEKGETEGVKYDRVGVVLVNAVNEQQAQIETQQKQLDEQAEIIKRQQEKLERQQSEIEALKALVCANNRAAGICQEKKP